MHYLIIAATFALTCLSIQSLMNRKLAREPARKNRRY
jgi:hypothetical protein